MNEAADRDIAGDSGDRAFTGLRWVGAGRIVTQVIAWAMTAVTVRFLQPSDYGLIATAGLFTALAMLLLDGGLGIVLVTQKELPSRLLGASVSATLGIAVLLGIVIAVIAPVGSWFFRSRELLSILLVSALYMPLAALAVVPIAVLSRSMKFRQIAVAQALASLVQGLCSLSLAWLGVGYWALIIGNFAGTTLRVVMLWHALDTRIFPNLELSRVRPLIRSSSHMIGARLTYFVANDFDTFLISRFGGVVLAGPYALAKSLCHSALDQLSGIVNQVMVPVFAGKTDHNSQVNGLIQVISATSTLMFPMFWMMGTVSWEALPLVFGNRWTGLILPFMAFSLMLPLRSIYALLDTAVLGTGRSATTFSNMLVWAAVMMPLLLIGALWDLRSVAFMWSVGFPVVFVTALWRIARALNIRLAALLRPMVSPALCAAVAATMVFALNTGTHLPVLVKLAGDAVIGAGGYWLLLWRFGRSHHDQIFSLIRRLLKR
jgi:O-antigen/teichoic acid export membrane protein